LEGRSLADGDPTASAADRTARGEQSHQRDVASRALAAQARTRAAAHRALAAADRERAARERARARADREALLQQLFVARVETLTGVRTTGAGLADPNREATGLGG
jgi:hypothetical protein